MVISQSHLNITFPSVSYEIGREKVKEFVRAIKGDLEKYNEAIPPTFPVVYGTALLEAVLFHPELNLNLKKLVHGEQEFIYHKTVKIGDTITSSGHIEKIFNKGAHDFVVFKVSSHNQASELVCESIWTFVVRGGNDTDFSFNEKLAMKLASLLPSTSRRGDDSVKAPDYKISDSESRMDVLVDQYMPQRYAGASGDFNAIHLDEQLGKSVGLGGYILHGMATMAMGANLALKSKAVTDIRRYKVRFSAPVKPMDILTYIGSFSEDNKSYTFTAKNQKKQDVLNSCLIEFS